MKKGKLYLIPNLLGDSEADFNLPPAIKDIIESCSEFIVENERTARRFIKKSGASNDLDTLVMHPLHKHSDNSNIPSYLKATEQGNHIGIISESGNPCIADPGALVVAIAHEKNIDVIPLVGPSSILLTLISSGFNGQSFAFHGYLPKEENERIKRIKHLEQAVSKFRQTQIFMEAPFRNQKLLETLLKNCLATTKLCIATEITTPEEKIKTRTIAEWNKNPPNINKKNTVFAIGS